MSGAVEERVRALDVRIDLAKEALAEMKVVLPRRRLPEAIASKRPSCSSSD